MAGTRVGKERAGIGALAEVGSDGHHNLNCAKLKTSQT